MRYFIMIELELPYPPSTNSYYRNVRGRTLISSKGRKYQKEVCGIIKTSGIDKITGAIAVKVLLYTKDYIRQDADNRFKSLFDSVTKAGLWEDDSFICAIVCEKRKDADGVGRVILQIKPVENATVKKAGAWLK